MITIFITGFVGGWIASSLFYYILILYIDVEKEKRYVDRKKNKRREIKRFN